MLQQAPYLVLVVLSTILFIVMKKNQVVVLVFFLCHSVYSQGDMDKFRLSASGGIAFRTTIMQNFDIQQSFNQTLYWSDYLYEKNIQGLSYQIGLKLEVPNPKLEITYRLGIRYDHTNNLLIRWTNDPEEKKAICPYCSSDIINNSDFEIAITESQKFWLFDHHIMLMIPFRNNKQLIGAGLTIVNANEYYVDYYGRKKEIEFMNYDLIYQRKIWRNILAQVNIIFIPKEDCKLNSV